MTTVTVASGLAFVGKTIEINHIENADNIVSARIVCGKGGIWFGVIQRDSFSVGDLCEVYLQDALLQPSPNYSFLEKFGWRIKMIRLRGARSEVLVLPLSQDTKNLEVGTDITILKDVKKYEAIPNSNISGETKGSFPFFVPKTDEPNFQRIPEILEILRNISAKVYITEKANGSSSTVFFVQKGVLNNDEEVFGCCSRNLTLKETDNNIIWNIAKKYNLKSQLRESGMSLALQFESIGPGIQKNEHELKEHEPRLFSIFDIEKQTYLGYEYLFGEHSNLISLPRARLLASEITLPETDEELLAFAEGNYYLDAINSKGEKIKVKTRSQREGVVIRPMEEQRFRGDRVSFKVLNLLHKG